MRNQLSYLVWERVVFWSEGLRSRARMQYEWYVAYAKAETDTNRKIRLSSLARQKERGELYSAAQKVVEQQRQLIAVG